MTANPVMPASSSLSLIRNRGWQEIYGIQAFDRRFPNRPPDLYSLVEEEIGKNARFAANWSMYGTHQGSILGCPPIGKLVEVQE